MKRIHRMLFLVGQTRVPYTLTYHDAKRDVVLSREDVDALNGNPGLAGECMNAQCALRQKHKFPHPVYLVEFTASRAWVVDRLARGAPRHCVRYVLSTKDREEIQRFDEPGGKQRMLRAMRRGNVDRALVLRAPTARVRGPHGDHHAAHKETGSQRRNPLARGSYARALRAGLLKLDQPKAEA